MLMQTLQRATKRIPNGVVIVLLLQRKKEKQSHNFSLALVIFVSRFEKHSSSMSCLCARVRPGVCTFYRGFVLFACFGDGSTCLWCRDVRKSSCFEPSCQTFVQCSCTLALVLVFDDFIMVS